ncbi:MAG: zinc ribbon domain-containing protein [Candidatus Margulisbacteria bacterium]|nr:zinc ribbon domain-containing protein [Candidatus Margulisiibacteriota bacterium]
MVKKNRIYPLSKIMYCLHCDGVINAVPAKKNFRYYRCGNYRKHPTPNSVRENILETKIRDIVIEYLPKFYIIENQLAINENKQRELEKLLAQKRECIDGFSEGLHPKHDSYSDSNKEVFMKDFNFEIINNGIKRVKSKIPFVFGDDTIKKYKEQYCKKQKALLLSDDYLNINDFYKKLIKVELDIEKSNGIIYFLFFEEHFSIDPYYKFSW